MPPLHGRPPGEAEQSMLKQLLGMDGGRQLSFPFAVEPSRRTAPRSRRELRRSSAPRRLRATADRPADEQRLEQALANYLPPGKTLGLTLTDNRYSMVAVRRAPSGYRVRIHRMFAGVEPRIVRALARYVVHNDRRASGVLGEYIERNKHIIKQQPRRPRQVTIRTAGRHFDLQAIYDRLNAEYFGGKIEARITWGPSFKSRRRRRSIKMGSFSVEDRVIRIHPSLDQPGVPPYFVAWIVFHEMLHGKHEVTRVGGRRCFHTREFLAEEKTFAHYERAYSWEKRNIDRLLGG
jgi:predicted metal-dependent hydrolase